MPSSPAVTDSVTAKYLMCLMSTPHMEPTQWHRPESRAVTPNRPWRRVIAEVQSRIRSVLAELNQKGFAMSRSEVVRVVGTEHLLQQR